MYLCNMLIINKKDVKIKKICFTTYSAYVHTCEIFCNFAPRNFKKHII